MYAIQHATLLRQELPFKERGHEFNEYTIVRKDDGWHMKTADGRWIWSVVPFQERPERGERFPGNTISWMKLEGKSFMDKAPKVTHG